jgi:hypothetical protein
MNNDGEESEGFVIPKSFLTQLNEYTRGFILIVCNEKGELYAHESYDNPVIKLGLTNFAEMHIAAAQKHMHNIALKEEENLENPNSEDDELGG